MAGLERSVDELIRELSEKYGHMYEISPKHSQNTKRGRAVFFFDWMAGRGPRCPSVWSGGQALGAVFNQLVRSRAQLLGAVVCSK